jgi:hypothetical protein
VAGATPLTNIESSALTTAVRTSSKGPSTAPAVAGDSMPLVSWV